MESTSKPTSSRYSKLLTLVIVFLFLVVVIGNWGGAKFCVDWLAETLGIAREPQIAESEFEFLRPDGPSFLVDPNNYGSILVDDDDLSVGKINECVGYSFSVSNITEEPRTDLELLELMLFPSGCEKDKEKWGICVSIGKKKSCKTAKELYEWMFP